MEALHRWTVSPAKAREIQEQFRGRVRAGPLRRRVRRVAGADVSVDRQRERVHAAVVVLGYPGLEPIEARTHTRRLTFPYVPGLLSFREAPAILAIFRRLRTRPDVLICDGQGLAHPRRLGLASHLGLWLGVPTIGCAKSLLVGEHEAVGEERGAAASLVLDGETVGAVLRTRDGVKPVYVSPGHLIDTATACDIVLGCCRRYRLPEPIRAAHRLAGERARRQE
ncbi:MAG: deoxyribonuclease V [Armatimonadota bacterium]